LLSASMDLWRIEIEIHSDISLRVSERADH
jgi:hypothetical protein